MVRALGNRPRGHSYRLQVPVGYSMELGLGLDYRFFLTEVAVTLCTVRIRKLLS